MQRQLDYRIQSQMPVLVMTAELLSEMFEFQKGQVLK
jgi:hypothetical protein